MDKINALKKSMGWLLVVSLLFGGFSMLSPLELYAATKDATVATPQTVVNLNKATSEELQTVRGIGPALAERIMKYREEHGRFEKADDLVNVRGIGEAKFQKIKNQISI